MGGGKKQKRRQRDLVRHLDAGSGGARHTSASSWTEDTADRLQEAVDRIFGEAGDTLLGLDFSFTIADPFLQDCPLIGCSTGFTKLCGYEVRDIVGRNCRFLVDPVPPEQIDADMRRHTKDFCLAVKLGEEYTLPPERATPWMSEGRPADELVAMQKNARKDGTLFNNLFFMKVLDLSPELGDEKPYIVGLQSELKDGPQAMAEIHANITELSQRMTKVMALLARFFSVQCSLSRIMSSHRLLMPSTKDSAGSNGSGSSSPEAETSPEAEDIPSDTPSSDSVTPEHLYSAFAPQEVRQWEQERFTFVRKLCDAPRNKGQVQLMHDQEGDRLVAVKLMPNQWLRDSHEEFVKMNETETELPWQDIGCTKFLNSIKYKYVCDLLGVFRTDDETFVTSAFAPGGDLFSVALAAPPPGPARETVFTPLVLEIFSGMKQLHEMQIVHRDISLENVVLASEERSSCEIRIIDYGMADSRRMFQKCVRGKMTYQAPEMHAEASYDGFLTDAFSVGVLVYALLLSDYPWFATKIGDRKNFDYVRRYGFRSYASKRKVRGTNMKVSDCLSNNMTQLLDGMLAIDPSERLTLGEKQWSHSSRRSVWDEPWVTRAKCRKTK